MPIWSRLTGEKLEYATPEQREAQRLARMRKNVWTGVMMLKDAQGASGGLLVMYTLTYASVKDWTPRHISGCMRWLRGQGVRHYVWVAELQKRGAVHYHVLALLPEGQRWVKPSKSAGGWAHGFTWVSDGIKKPFYIMKYLQKGQGNGKATHYPKGLRLYAVSQGAVRNASFENAVDWRKAHLPTWFVDDGKEDGRILGSRRCPGGATYGKLVEYSPYTTRPLPDDERISQLLTQAWESSTIMPAQ